MRKMPEEIQAEVTQRIATLDKVSPEILREVERVLEKKLSSISSEGYQEPGGVEVVVKIPKATDKASVQIIFEGLEKDIPELADAFKNKFGEIGNKA